MSILNSKDRIVLPHGLLELNSSILEQEINKKDRETRGCVQCASSGRKSEQSTYVKLCLSSHPKHYHENAINNADSVTAF
jgi:hypothetical protein